MTDLATTEAPRRQGQRGPKPGEFEWTERRVEMLKSMWADGKSQGQIAEALGIGSRSAVSGKIARLGLSRRIARAPKRERAPACERGKHQRRASRQAHRPPEPWTSTAVLPEGRLYFEDLTNDVCHFPVGDGPVYLFCGADTELGPYCPSCAAIARMAPRVRAA